MGVVKYDGPNTVEHLKEINEKLEKTNELLTDILEILQKNPINPEQIDIGKMLEDEQIRRNSS